MRPIELTVEGFRSYAGRATFDWRDRRLVGVVGPIGAGKSSILDAMAFALYGKTPTVSRDTGDLINQRSDRAIVELIFEVEGETWRAVRGQTRKGQPPFRLVRLDAEGETIETVTGKTAMNARIEQLVGLPFETFCRSVLLAQNQFERFLKATTGDRDKVLKGVFGLEVVDRAHVVAKQRLAMISRDLDEYDRRQSEIAEARSRLAAAQEEAKEVNATFDRLKKAAPEVRKKRSALEEAERAEAETTAALGKLAATSERLPPDVDAVAASALEAERAEKAATAALSSAELAHARAQMGLASAEGTTGGRSVLTEASGLIKLAGERGDNAGREAARARQAEAAVIETQERLKSEKEIADRLETEAEAAEVAVSVASAEVEIASRQLDEAKHAETALILRIALEEGGTCPVCRQPVHTLPKSEKAPKIADAKRAADRARKNEDAALARLERARTDLIGARVKTDATEKELARSEHDGKDLRDSVSRAQAASAETLSSLEALLGKGDASELIAERETLLSDAEQVERDGAATVAAARRRMDEMKHASAEMRSSLQSIANRLAAISGAIGIPLDVEATPRIAGVSQRLGAAIAKQRSGLETALAQAELTAEGARKTLRELLSDFQIDDAVGFESALQEAEVASASREAGIAAMKASIASEKDLKGRIEAAVVRRERLKRLVDDLTPSRFLRSLLEEDRMSLAELGSEHCERLTNGRYRFSDDGSFDIVDLTAAERVRKAESLSGGETFLASLSLALALAEMVARGGGRLDAFFLDEGFGSLDPEHLDLAMDGIDRLIADSSNRLVVVVSHVPEMRERLEDLIVLDKNALTGETIVVSGASR